MERAGLITGGPGPAKVSALSPLYLSGVLVTVSVVVKNRAQVCATLLGLEPYTSYFLTAVSSSVNMR